MTPEQLTQDVAQLVSLPRAYHRISEMLDDPNYGAADIGNVITHEPALAARLLRMVNSAYYNFPSRIDNVPLAITVLGTRALRDMVLGTSVANAFARIDTELVDMADFWQHSIYCGLLSRLIGKQLNHRGSEQLFLAGLLHDLGKLVIYTQIPEQAARVLREFKDSNTALFVVEKEILGFTHAEVGEALLTNWQLPALFREVAAYHHAPDAAQQFPVETCIVHVADALTKKVEPGHKLAERDGGEHPRLHPFADAYVNLDPADIDELRLEADVQSIEVFRTLFGDTPVGRTSASST